MKRRDLLKGLLLSPLALLGWKPAKAQLVNMAMFPPEQWNMPHVCSTQWTLIYDCDGKTYTKVSNSASGPWRTVAVKEC